MKFLSVVGCGVQLELDATDLLQLADALHYAANRDMPGNRSHLATLETALTACAILAAHDTNTDTATPEERRLAETRKVWGPVDTTGYGQTRVAEEPR